MKKGIILHLKRFKLMDYVTCNKIFILLCTLFIVGIIIGSTLLTKNNWLSQNSEFLFDEFIKLHNNNSFIKKFVSCFTRYILILILYFLFGSSMLGAIVTPFLTVWQGIVIGDITSYVYSTYGLNGIAFNAIVLVLPLSIFTLSCFFAAKYAIDFSLNIAKLTLPKSRPTNLYIDFKKYCCKFLILIGIIVICSLVEIILNLFFLKFFIF